MRIILLMLFIATIQLVSAQSPDSALNKRKALFYSPKRHTLSSYHPFGYSAPKVAANNNFTQPTPLNAPSIKLNWTPGDPKFIKDPYKTYYQGGSWILSAAQLLVPGMQRYNVAPSPVKNIRR